MSRDDTSALDRALHNSVRTLILRCLRPIVLPLCSVRHLAQKLLTEISRPLYQSLSTKNLAMGSTGRQLVGNSRSSIVVKS